MWWLFSRLIAAYGTGAVGYFLYFIWVFPPPIRKRSFGDWMIASVLGAGSGIFWLPILVMETLDWVTKKQEKEKL